MMLWSEGKVGQTTYWPFYGVGEEHLPPLVDTPVIKTDFRRHHGRT